MPRKFWWHTSMPQQLVQVENFMLKISTHASVLGMTPDEVTAAEELCVAFIGAFNATEHAKTTMQAMTQWREKVFYGEGGKPAPQAPVFQVVGPVTYGQGVVHEFFALRDRIVASAGYTTSIGEDLGIVGAEISPRPADEVIPVLRASVSNGNWIQLSGSMQGMDALRVEYSSDGSNFSTVAFLTNTPGGFQLESKVPNQPEKGFLRAVFIKKNAPYGNFSPNYPVTIS